MDREQIECTVRGPVPMLMDDDRIDSRTGCSVLDASFPHPVKVGEIAFKNVYTAYMTVLCKRITTSADLKDRSDLKWEKCIDKHVLMEDPHCENGSQSYVSLTQKNSRLALIDVVELRLVLYQPSPVWKKFGLERFAVYTAPPSDLAKQITVPRHLLSESHRVTHHKTEAERRHRCAASHLQNLWALLEQGKANSTDVTVGRFEINGVYDINFLSCN